MPTPSHYAVGAAALAVVTLSLVLGSLIRPVRLHLAYSLVLRLAALGTMRSFEFVREAIRKPFVIANYMYDNALYATPSATDGGFSVEAIDKAGVLNTARWVRHADGIAAGQEIFRVECQSCHTVDAYRGVRRLLAVRQWDASQLNAMLLSPGAFRSADAVDRPAAVSRRLSGWRGPVAGDAAALSFHEQASVRRSGIGSEICLTIGC